MVAFVLIATALLAANASPSPSPLPTSTPGADPCRGPSSLLSELNRPTIGFSVCTVEPLSVTFEEGYQVQQSGGQSLVQYQGFVRFGVTSRLEVDANGLLFNRLAGRGRVVEGLSDSGIGAKYRFQLSGPVTAAVDALYSTPNGAAAFTAGSSTEALNLDLGTNISATTGAATTLAFVRNARYVAFMPSVVVTHQVASHSQVYLEYVAQSDIGNGLGGRSFLDYGFQQLLGPNLELDVERGSTFTGDRAKAFRYFGAGFGVKFPFR
jgi:hypothetical protein